MTAEDAKTRFGDRVRDYEKFRPGYPKAVLETLIQDYSLSSKHVVADIGSGTGISSEIFLQNGNFVFGVEPNAEMRRAAELKFLAYDKFVSVDGSSEATTLQGDSADFIVVAQAFHWFPPQTTRTEFQRVLRSGGVTALLYNDRKLEGSNFSVEYENLLNEFGTDYKVVKHTNVTQARRLEFLGAHKEYGFPNSQSFDFKSLLGRVRSSSYAPNEGHPRYPQMVNTLRHLFEKNQTEGVVVMEYVTRMFCSVNSS